MEILKQLKFFFRMDRCGVEDLELVNDAVAITNRHQGNAVGRPPTLHSVQKRRNSIRQSAAKKNEN